MRLDVTQLTTPAGNPASSASLQSARAVKGVSSAGLMTTVQPGKFILNLVSFRFSNFSA